MRDLFWTYLFWGSAKWHSTTFNHLRCYSSSTALGTRTGYWNPTRRVTDETPLWGWKKCLWFLPLWIISLKYEGCWWKKFSMHTFIHWHPSERMFPHFMRKKGLERRFAPVCFQYWTFIGIDAITRPNVYIRHFGISVNLM